MVSTCDMTVIVGFSELLLFYFNFNVLHAACKELVEMNSF